MVVNKERKAVASKAWYEANKEKIAARKTANKEKDAARQRERYAAKSAENPTYRREQWLYRQYGLTLLQYEEILATQGGACAACLEPPNGKRLVVDHDHTCCPGNKTCGECVRGLLCSTCNKAEGLLKSNPEVLRRLAGYIEGGGIKRSHIVTREKSGRRGVVQQQKYDNPCRVCNLSSLPTCICPGGAKSSDRDTYAQLRTLIDAYEHHRNVDRFHCETVYDKDIYDLWVTKATELEGIL